MRKTQKVKKSIKLIMLLLAMMPFVVSANQGLEKLKYQKGKQKQNDINALRAEVLIAKSEKKALKQVNRLLRKYRGTALESDLLLRKAELYMRMAKTERFFELSRDVNHIASLAPKKIKKASSRKYVNKSIKIYDSIIKRFKRFEKLDVVIFNNAFANQQIGNAKKAEKLYWLLVKSYGWSPLVADAHLAIGEMAFKQKRFKHSLSHFNAIKKYPQARVYPYGLYKGAWAYYNLQDTTQALKELEEVVKYGRYVEEQQIDARLDLRKEALSDMALFFSDVFPAKNAYSYLKKQSGTLDAAPYILKVANLYKRHSKYGNRAIVLNDFIKNEVTSTEIPRAYSFLAENYETMKKRELVVKALGDFYAACAENSPWYKANSKPEKVKKTVKKKTTFILVDKSVDDCRKRSQQETLNYASKWLKYWKKSKSEKYATPSEAAFRIYLRYDLKNAKFYDAKFIFAEYLFARKGYREASEHFSKVGESTGKKKQAHSARYFAILSLEKAVKADWSKSDEALFNKLAQAYLKNHKNAKFELDVKFQKGLIDYNKKRYADAKNIFIEIGSKFFKTKKGIQSQDIVLDILNIEKDYVGLKNYAATLVKRTKSKKRSVKLNKVYEESYFLQIQNLEEEKDYEAAITEYNKFAKEKPKSKLAANGLWNAIQLHYKLDQQMKGALATLEFSKKFPKHKRTLESLVKAATVLESMGQLKQAAATVLKLKKLDKPTSGNKWNMLAASFYRLAGEKQQARKIYKKVYLSNSKKYSFKALLALKDLAPNKKEKEKNLRAIILFGKQPHKSEAEVYFLSKMVGKKSDSEVFTAAKKILSTRKDGASNKALAEARFIQAEILDKEFKRQSVKTSVDRLTMVLELKTARLDKAQRGYQAVIRYGDAKTLVRSLQRLANLYKHYSESLNSMPLPKGLDKSEETVFRSEINRIAIPMEEKYIETLSQALSEAKRLNVQDGTVGKLQAALNKMNHQKTAEPINYFKLAPTVLPVFKGVDHES